MNEETLVNSVSENDSSLAEKTRLIFARLLLTSALSCLFTILTVLILSTLLRASIKPDPNMIEVFTQSTWFFVYPEPLERTVFQLTVIVLPLIVMLSYLMSGLIPSNLFSKKMISVLSCAVSFISLIIINAWAFVPSRTILLEMELMREKKGMDLPDYLKDAVTAIAEKDFFRSMGLGDFRIILPIASLLVLSCFLIPSFRVWIFLKLKRFLPPISIIIVAISLLSAISFRFFSWKKFVLEDFSASQHLNPVLYYTLLADSGNYKSSMSSPQYGFYSFYLKPLFDVLGVTVMSFSTVMTIIYLLGLGFIVFSCFKLIKNQILRILLVPALCAVQGVLSNGSSWDPYFQYFPIRFIIPAFSVFLMYSMLQNKNFCKNIYLLCFSSFILGFLVPWNFDSDIVAVIAWNAVLFIIAVSDTVRLKSLKNASVRNCIVSFIMCALGSTLVFFILFGSDKGNLSFAELMQAQKTFYISGLCMLPMPLKLHPWMGLVLVYITTLSFSLPIILRKGSASSIETIMIFHLALLGTGLFAYYQGRSHDMVLPTVLWPVIVCSFIASDCLFREKDLSNCFCMSMPLIAIALAFSFKLILAFPSHVLRSEPLLALKEGDQGMRKEKTFFNTIAWLSEYRNEAPGAVLILHPAQSVLYAESGLPPSDLLPSDQENMATNKQVEYTNKLLSSGKFRHIFISPNWRDNSQYVMLSDSIDKHFRQTESLALSHWEWKEKGDQ